MSDTTCVLPWMHMATNSAGNLRVCCNSTPGKNLIYRNGSIPYNITDDDVLSFWDSETLVNLRHEFIEGKRPAMCARCFGEEALGIKSARQAWNEKWPTDCTTTTPPLNIKYVDLRLGNLCNLKCRMCNPYASSQWVDEWQLIYPTTPTAELSKLKKMQWIDNPIIWDNLAKLSDSIEEIYLTGGEPTLAISQYKLFDKLILSGHAKNITLKYNTNLTNIPRKMIEYWKHFKLIRVNASVDAVGNLNHYIRFPSDWNTIDKNLKIFNELGKLIALQIHVTVQAYNILYLDNLLEYLELSGYHNIYLNILDHPDYLNIRSLPEELKQHATKLLQQFSHIKKIDGVVTYMNSEHWFDTQWDNFCKYTAKLDTSRGQSLIEVAPIFKDFTHD